MAKLTPTAVKKAGIADLDTALVAADVAGDSVDQSSGLLIVMKNADASPHTLTVAKPVASADCGEFGALTVADLTLVVAAGDTGFLTIPNGYINAGGDFAWTYDAVTSVTVGVFSLAP